MTATLPSTAPTPVPVCDVRATGLLLEHVAAFRRHGVLAVRGVVDDAELAEIQAAGSEIVDWAWQVGMQPDTVWTRTPGEPGAVPIRVEYVVDKHPALHRLAGHPLLLQVAEAMCGPNLIPTWDSMVFKTEQGAPRLAWHRDGEMYDDEVATIGSGRVVDVGVYLDDAPAENCVWAIPGSNYAPRDEVTRTAERLNATEWDATGAVPAQLRAGDVLVHNILTLHAAPAVVGSRRRVVYFEYRPGELEWELGPHTREYVGLKQRSLLSSVRARAEARPDETPYAYDPAPAMRHWRDDDGPLPSLRFAHDDHWAWRRPE